MRFQQNLAAGQVEHCTVGSGCAVAVEKEDDNGWAAVRPSVSGGVAPNDRGACGASTSGAHSGVDNSSRVGMTSRGEAVAAVRARRRWRGRPMGGVVERRRAGGTVERGRVAQLR
jgi:hypothetical protein